MSDLSWTESGEEAVKKYKKSEELEAVVMAVDVERERISLSVKQLHENENENKTSGSSLEKGMSVNGKVSSVDTKGAVVTLSDGVECYLRSSDISREKVEDARSVLKEGDPIEAIVVNVSRKTGEINISIKAKDSADAADAMQKMAAEGNVNSGTTNLGALLKAKLDKPEE